MELRPYQAAAIDRCRAQIAAGSRRVLLVVPTGGGKTVQASNVVRRALERGKRALFVAHRLELIDQAASTFDRIGVRSYGVIRGADKRLAPEQPLQIASIQTLARRPPPPNIDLVIVDEAHRALAPSYVKHLFDTYSSAVFLGLTATPTRADGKPLGGAWHSLVLGACYSELLSAGWLAPPLVYSTPVLPDLSKVRTRAGDYDLEELEEAVNQGRLVGNLIEQWGKHGNGRRTVVFAVSVAHSRAIVQDFTAHGVRAEHLDGTTPEDERRSILTRLEAGLTHVVSNVGVLCEGWDQPSCKCLVLARPTKSLALYMQMAGRVLRPWNDVQPIILDHGGNVDRHGLPHEDREWSLESRVRSGGAPRTRLCPECYAYIPPASNPCPHCGHEFTRAEMAAAEDETDDEPVPVDLALRSLTGDDAQLSFFRRTAATARSRGWKYGAVFHRFREKFGTDPVPEWVAALRSDYRHDDAWKAAVKDAEPRRKAWRESQRVAS